MVYIYMLFAYIWNIIIIIIIWRDKKRFKCQWPDDRQSQINEKKRKKNMAHHITSLLIFFSFYYVFVFIELKMKMKTIFLFKNRLAINYTVSHHIIIIIRSVNRDWLCNFEPLVFFFLLIHSRIFFFLIKNLICFFFGRGGGNFLIKMMK